MDVDSIFEALGGPAAVGRLIGKSTEHAATLRRRRSIPVRYWPKIIGSVSKVTGELITDSDLVRAHATADAA